MKKTQYDIIKEHLENNETITSLEAINLYGITRLSGVIYNLRHDGYDIISKDKAVMNRFGNVCHVAEYRLNK